MKKYGIKSVTKREETLLEIKCDICEQEIKNRAYYYEILKGHYEWGNDSIDSVENREICSVECLKKEMEIFLKEKADSKYIEISKKRAMFKYWKEVC